MNLGFVGAGKIVHRCFDAVKDIESVNPVAIWSTPNGVERAAGLKEKYGLEATYTDYDAFLAHPGLDGVYIGIVNNMHYIYAKRALEAGKAVILEKPFTSTGKEAKELYDIAMANNVMLVEAVSFLSFPILNKIKDYIKKLDNIHLFIINYTQYSSRYDAYRAKEVLPTFDPAYSGGALYDINIYNLNLAYALFGKPESFRYYANMGFNQVDTSGVAVYDYGQFKAILAGVKDSRGESFGIIEAENGYIRINGAPPGLRSVDIYIDGEHYYEEEVKENHLRPEMEEFSKMFDSGDDSWKKRAAVAVEIMEMAEEMRKQVGMVFDADKE
jgi:predicted dehydrogenase